MMEVEWMVRFVDAWMEVACSAPIPLGCTGDENERSGEWPL